VKDPGAGIRCRIAPAPSGSLHIGNARTALYNWLFARHQGGTFVLRIEDTDRTRVTEEAAAIVLDSLRWLGIDWDEGPEVGGPYGPYRQSERMETYRRAEARLRAAGRAYDCYCTPEELEERRKAALARGEPPGYDGRCRTLSDEDLARFRSEGRVPAVRFATTGEDVIVPDLIRGDVHFRGRDIFDFVILRGDGTPTYLLAAAVDDLEMAMTHVIRGEDLLPSTPRQIQLIHVLGDEPPAYAHLPLIVGPDRQPLSKRHGAVAVETFRTEGFLPEAMVNYLALLGWSYDEETTFHTREQLIERFDLSRVSHNAAAFDRAKLEWMNGHYIREAADASLAGPVAGHLAAAGVDAAEEDVFAAIPLVKERIKLLSEAPALLRFLFVDDVEPDAKAARMLGPERAEFLREAALRLEAIEDWNPKEIEAVLRGLQEDRELPSTQAFQPIRAAVTGALVSPPLWESLALLGRDRTLARLHAAADRAEGRSRSAGGP